MMDISFNQCSVASLLVAKNKDKYSIQQFKVPIEDNEAVLELRFQTNVLIFVSPTKENSPVSGSQIWRFAVSLFLFFTFMPVKRTFDSLTSVCSHGLIMRRIVVRGTAYLTGDDEKQANISQLTLLNPNE